MAMGSPSERTPDADPRGSAAGAAGPALNAKRRPSASAAGNQRPNIVVIQTDDQTLAELRATRITPLGNRVRAMPNTLDLIRKHGVSFNRYMASYPLCCPSRSTLLSGRYSHSNGVLSNSAPRGGWVGYRHNPIYRHNLGVWLQRAGYRTIHLGKFLNEYGGPNGPMTRRPGSRPAGTSGRATPPTTRPASTTAICSTGTASSAVPSASPNTARSAPRTPRLPAGRRRRWAAATTRRTCSPNGRCARSTVPRRRAVLPPARLQRAARRQRPADRPGAGAPATATRRSTPAADGRPDSTRPTSPTSPASSATMLTSSDRTNFRRMRIEYQKSLESLRSVDEGVGRVIGALRRSRRARQHLRLLHLRQRLLLRRAPAGAFEVPAL